MNIVQQLEKRELVRPPPWLSQNIVYLASVGSVAYGVSSGTSDFDVYGICIPKKELVFPHLAGKIEGFGKQKKRFSQWQEHHIMDDTALGGKGRMYDFAVYSIVRYFQLCMEGNPNMIDSLFVPRRCILYSTALGEKIREHRRMFLHKGCYHKFTGYAYSQLHKMEPKQEEKIIENPNGTETVIMVTVLPKSEFRAESVKKYGYDVKYAYHLVRLCLECRQILEEQDLDLERNREILKSIRRGEWPLDRVKGWFEEKERQLEELYHTSNLPYGPDEARIKDLLMECLEHHYGNLAIEIVPSYDRTYAALQKIRDIAEKEIGILTE